MDNTKKRGRPAGAVPTHKRSVTFPAGLYARLEKIALRDERTVNDLIVTALRELVKKEDAPGNRTPAPRGA